jgi:hypothetical protein
MFIPEAFCSLLFVKGQPILTVIIVIDIVVQVVEVVIDFPLPHQQLPMVQTAFFQGRIKSVGKRRHHNDPPSL